MFGRSHSAAVSTQRNGGLVTSEPRPQRLDARRDRYAERTIITSDGVRLEARDYGSAATATHTVVLLHGLAAGHILLHEKSELVTNAISAATGLGDQSAGESQLKAMELAV